MWFGKRPGRIYLDHASATPLCAAAVRAMRDAEHLVGNPGAIHAEGVEAAHALSAARASIAGHLAVKPRELIFTSGLTEANNIGILGFARALERVRRSLAGTHWLVSAIEHDSVLGCFEEIERLGGTVTHVDPDARGIIKPETVAQMLRPETVFVSVGWANNEIGVIQPLAKIAQAIRVHEAKHATTVALHTDAGQAPLYLPATARSLGVDLLSLGAEKLYGPHGIGVLFVHNRIALAKTSFGGVQERGLRAGTENVALAAGLAAAFDTLVAVREEESEKERKARDNLAREIVARLPGVIINGDLKHSLPHMLNISIPDIDSEYVTLSLDHAGVAVSTKSACREGQEKLSHVVAALGGDTWRARNTIRFSLGRDSRAADMPDVAQWLAHIVERSA